MPIKNVYQYFPRYVPGEPRVIQESERHELGAAEQKACALALKEPPLSEAYCKAARYGLFGIIERIDEHPEGWRVYDLLAEECTTHAFEKGDKAACARKELILFGVAARRVINRARTPLAKLYEFREVLVLEERHALKELRSTHDLLAGILKRANYSLTQEEEGKFGGLSSCGTLQGSGTTLDVVTARYTHAKQTRTHLDAVIEGRDPYTHYSVT